MDQSTVGDHPDPSERSEDAPGAGAAEPVQVGEPDSAPAPTSITEFDPLRKLAELQQRLGISDLPPAASDTSEMPWAAGAVERSRDEGAASGDGVDRSSDRDAPPPPPSQTERARSAAVERWAPRPPSEGGAADPHARSLAERVAEAGRRIDSPANEPAGDAPVRPLQPPAEEPTTQTTTPPVQGVARSARAMTPPGRSYAFPDPRQAAAPKAERRRRRWPAILVALVSGFLGTLLAVGLLVIFGVLERPAANDPEAIANEARALLEETQPQTTVIERITRVVEPSEGVGIAAAVGQKVIPSIVTVITDDGSGSGVVLTDDGYIATNDHVIANGATFSISFNDGRTYDAELVGTDPLTDLAVLKVEALALPAIEIGATSDLVIGDTAIAVGSPLGLEGGPSLTVGVLSAFNRSVGVGPDPGDTLFGMLQTDAPITLGSSGGALVDAAGRLIGITTAIGVSSAGAEGIGFATPSEIVTRIVDEIIETGQVRHAFLGVSLGDHTVEEPDGSVTPGGSLVSDLVGDESAAGQAGIQPGDIIVRFDENHVRTRQDLIVGLRRYRVGDNVEFEIVRDGGTVLVNVELGERPDGV